MNLAQYMPKLWALMQNFQNLKAKFENKCALDENFEDSNKQFGETLEEKIKNLTFQCNVQKVDVDFMKKIFTPDKLAKINSSEEQQKLMDESIN